MVYMKHIYIVGLIIVLCCFFVLPAKAQTVTCGVAETETAQCCCADISSAYNIIDTSHAGIIGTVLGGAINKAGLLVKSIFTPDFELDAKIAGACQDGEPSNKVNPCAADCICQLTQKSQGKASLCYKYLEKEKEFASCTKCFQGNGYWSALGCIYLTNYKDLVEKNISGYLIGFAGMISFLCIIFAAFQMQTSGGNPEKIKKAQELLTSCIMGLMLIIFSIFILRLIGVTLQIPGFS